MRVAIDLSGLARPGSGSDTYFRHLTLALAREIAPLDDLVGFLNRFGSDSQDAELPPVRVLISRWPWRILGTLWGFGILSVDRLTGPVDVFHANDWTCPPLRKGRIVATVFDLAFERYPELYPPDILRLHRRQLDCVRRRASAVVAISAHTKEDLRAAWGAEKTPEIRVIHPAGDPIYAEARNLEAERELRARLGLPEEYLLYLGTSAPRKNLPRLVRAYALARQAGVRSPLVIAGSTGLVSGMPIHGSHSWDARQVSDAILARGLEGSVLVTGHLARADAAHLMRGARAFVFPSLYEGFGLPVLEAMSAGVPVIASSTSALPEVGGDAILYVDPTNEESIADAIVRVDGAAELRRDLAARGLRRSGKFSWAATARETLAFYRDLVGETR